MSEERDLKMLHDRERWPAYPILPVVHRVEGSKMGVVTCMDLTKIYLCNMFDLQPGRTLGVQLKEFPSQTYDSPEALIAEWRVD